MITSARMKPLSMSVWILPAALTALVPLGTLYGIQGLAVSGHVLAIWRIPWVMRFLGFFLLALWIPAVLIAGVGLAGLFDTWFDFRRRLRPPAAAQ